MGAAGAIAAGAGACCCAFASLRASLPSCASRSRRSRAGARASIDVRSSARASRGGRQASRRAAWHAHRARRVWRGGGATRPPPAGRSFGSAAYALSGAGAWPAGAPASRGQAGAAGERRGASQGRAAGDARFCDVLSRLGQRARRSTAGAAALPLAPAGRRRRQRCRSEPRRDGRGRWRRPPPSVCAFVAAVLSLARSNGRKSVTAGCEVAVGAPALWTVQA